MCFGGGSSVDNSVLDYQKEQDAQARADEEAKQARIASGREQIDALFDRGETLNAGSGVKRSGWRLYDAQGNDLGYDTNNADYMTAQLMKNLGVSTLFENEPFTTTPNTYSKTQTAFDSDFYNNRRQSYIDNYTPQLDTQFADARAKLGYALAKAGLTRSSVAADQVARLNSDYAVQAGDIASKADADVASLRTQVEDRRADLVNQLNASADASGTANLALARTKAIASEPVTYSALGDVFSGVGSGVGSLVTGLRYNKISNLATDTANNVLAQINKNTNASNQGTTTAGTK